MKKLLSQAEIEEISLETGIESAFIEKDWFAVQLIALLQEYQSDHDVQIIFSGGTSLSKGYDLIQRFSEDLDFSLNTSPGQSLSQGQRRTFRRNLTKFVSADKLFNINDDEVIRGDSYRFFKAPIVYERLFSQGSLRPYLQLEMTFCEPRLPTEVCTIQSIAATTMGDDPEASISCISPLETAGDKLSALSWRVVVRDRNAEGDDPTIIRHLHDLAALEPVISKQQAPFAETAKQSLKQDQSRRGGQVISDMSVPDRLAKALEELTNDSLYRKEYEQFVLNMSYADEDKKIDFDGACSALERIINAC